MASCTAGRNDSVRFPVRQRSVLLTQRDRMKNHALRLRRRYRSGRNGIGASALRPWPHIRRHVPACHQKADAKGTAALFCPYRPVSMCIAAAWLHRKRRLCRMTILPCSFVSPYKSGGFLQEAAACMNTCPSGYLSMVSMVRCVLVKTQISAAMAMDSFTISEGVISVWRSRARAAESA